MCRLAPLTAILGLSLTSGWAQTKVATLDLTPYGVMTQGELNVLHPIPDPPPKYKGYLTSGPPGGIAWRGVGTLAIDNAGKVYVGLPIWASGYAPKNPARGTGDKFRVLVVDPAANGKVVRTTDFPTKSLNRLDLRFAADGTLLVLANDKLVRVDSGGKTTSQLAVPDEEKEFEVWDVESSPTGLTLRIRLNNKNTWIVNTKTLAVEKKCQLAIEDNDEGTMTDDMELSSRVESTQPQLVYQMEQQAFCEKGKILNNFGSISFVPDVVNDNQFLAIEKGSIALRNLNGGTVWTSPVPNSLFLDTSEGLDDLSRDSSRVAFQLMRTAQYQPPETTQATPKPVEDSVGVWDLATGRLVGQVPLLGHTTDRFFSPDSQIALSPDGKMLAVLEDGVLSMWKIE
jgi:WD40 repeat protein